MELFVFFVILAILFWFAEQPSKSADIPSIKRDRPVYEPETLSKQSSATLKQYEIEQWITQKRQYLKSTAWQTLRKSTLQRDNYTCQQCKATGIPLEVHHLHYHTFTRETGKELVSLCRTCHGVIHHKYGYDFTSSFPLL